MVAEKGVSVVLFGRRIVRRPAAAIGTHSTARVVGDAQRHLTAQACCLLQIIRCQIAASRRYLGERRGLHVVHFAAYLMPLCKLALELRRAGGEHHRLSRCVHHGACAHARARNPIQVRAAQRLVQKLYSTELNSPRAESLVNRQFQRKLKSST